jgi:hypothetical protein
VRHLYAYGDRARSQLALQVDGSSCSRIAPCQKPVSRWYVQVSCLRAMLGRLGVRGVDLRASRHEAPGLKDRETVAHATGVKGTIEVAGPLDSIGWQVAER